jgi:hypothetical protein
MGRRYGEEAVSGYIEKLSIVHNYFEIDSRNVGKYPAELHVTEEDDDSMMEVTFCAGETQERNQSSHHSPCWSATFSKIHELFESKSRPPSLHLLNSKVLLNASTSMVMGSFALRVVRTANSDLGMIIVVRIRYPLRDSNNLNCSQKRPAFHSK